MGLGWFIDHQQLGELAAFQSGIIKGPTSLIAILPEKKLGIVLLSNSEAFEQVSHSLAFKTLELMLETKLGWTRPAPISAKQLSIPFSEFKPYTGKYVMNGEIANVYLEGEKLMIQLYGDAIPLIPLSESKFEAKHRFPDVGGVTVTFINAEAVNENIPGDFLILTLDKSYNTVCPKYPEKTYAPYLWQGIAGRYEIYSRVDRDRDGISSMGQMEIELIDDVLISAFHQAALIPLNEIEILMVGGVFDGEIMLRDRDSGNISWSSQIYQPKSSR
jgi:hypothetical protein